MSDKEIFELLDEIYAGRKPLSALADVQLEGRRVNHFRCWVDLRIADARFRFNPMAHEREFRESCNRIEDHASGCGLSSTPAYPAKDCNCGGNATAVGATIQRQAREANKGPLEHYTAERLAEFAAFTAGADFTIDPSGNGSEFWTCANHPPGSEVTVEKGKACFCGRTE